MQASNFTNHQGDSRLTQLHIDAPIPILFIPLKHYPEAFVIVTASISLPIRGACHLYPHVVLEL